MVERMKYVYCFLVDLIFSRKGKQPVEAFPWAKDALVNHIAGTLNTKINRHFKKNINVNKVFESLLMESLH